MSISTLYIFEEIVPYRLRGRAKYHSDSVSLTKKPSLAFVSLEVKSFLATKKTPRDFGKDFGTLNHELDLNILPGITRATLTSGPPVPPGAGDVVLPQTVRDLDLDPDSHWIADHETVSVTPGMETYVQTGPGSYNVVPFYNLDIRFEEAEVQKSVLYHAAAVVPPP